MATPKALILRAPGTNCDGETAFAFQLAGGQAERVHLNRLLDQPNLAEGFQILCLPGGFSYGDDIAAGRIVGSQIRHHLDEVLRQFIDAGKLVLGICNGFQILLKSGILLPDSDDGHPPATLAWNESQRFVDRWVHLKTFGDKCVFLKDIEKMYLPVAHAEGRFAARDAATLAALDKADQLALRYTDAAGGEAAFPDCPNGAQLGVAGACDSTGRVFGLMPHPERHLDPTHHPRWTRGEAGEVGDGLKIFQNAVEYFS
ncbi:phosphoribosylformylglycinamidine synthase I [Blastopirellula retiformator]|uniref:Phosphoribosylformylglycinamidine synthase n=1 Tax=Blastopirellula retiformator TaxID=2527970 RepID=A0A5C5UYI7_9BACT|nr:phosphoribosylformylglycinamidine synthase I [Blastopirellula retiformator]TWT30909.1 Phosphoribosylformylglycinamidine synthase [Blastopirellula retiformator]